MWLFGLFFVLFYFSVWSKADVFYTLALWVLCHLVTEMTVGMGRGDPCVTKKCSFLVLPLASFGNRARDFFIVQRQGKKLWCSSVLSQIAGDV